MQSLNGEAEILDFSELQTLLGEGGIGPKAGPRLGG